MSHLQGFQLLGGDFDVCCPGQGLTTNGMTYCCIGQNDDYNNGGIDVCLRAPSGCVGTDQTSSCSVAVPVTADDYSQKVSQATATMSGTSTSSGAADSSVSIGAAPARITAPPWFPLAVIAGGIMLNDAVRN